MALKTLYNYRDTCNKHTYLICITSTVTKGYFHIFEFKAYQ